MTIDVLVCYPDGTQVLEQREVPDDYFAAAEPAEEPAQSEEESVPQA